MAESTVKTRNVAIFLSFWGPKFKRPVVGRSDNKFAVFGYVNAHNFGLVTNPIRLNRPRSISCSIFSTSSLLRIVQFSKC